MINTIEESITISMDGSDKKLFPFIPYILQDIWEIGSLPEIIIDTIKNHKLHISDLTILDLGCGKGAVSIKIAKSLQCKCHGIDGISEFIDFANQKANEWQVDHLCSFEQGDIRKQIESLEKYDVIILGSIGPVLGDYFKTMSKLEKHLSNDGVIILDDGYIPDDSDFKHSQMVKKEQLIEQILKADMNIIDEIIIDDDEIGESYKFIFEKLSTRCFELIQKHPDKRQLFENYIKKQEEENNVLENEVICSTMVIKRN